MKIEDREGNVIEDNTQPDGTQVLPLDVAQKINDVLSDPVAREPLGVNSALNFPGHDVAVKTGTTNDYRDAWTIGYTPNIVLGMWAGNNDNHSMEKKVSGLIVGPMWHDVMQYILSKYPSESFTRSEYNYDSLKPALRGNWQVAGSDGQYHEILYWVDTDNPTGPAPVNPNNDPQFKYWDSAVQAWVLQHGVTPYIQTGAPTPTTNTTPSETPSNQQIIPGGIPAVGI